jgi:hypothetical protein
MFSYNRDTVRRLSLFLMVLDQTMSGMIPGNNLVTEAAVAPKVVGEGLSKELDHHGYNSGSIMSPPKYRSVAKFCFGSLYQIFSRLG